MKYKEVIKKLKLMGCQEMPRRGGGSHQKWYNPINNKIVPIPDWGSKDLKLGTLRQIIRELQLDWEEFKNL
jgi:predicted RNA binding protein YcfA (HicA-like mRNA interferase family)